MSRSNEDVATSSMFLVLVSILSSRNDDEEIVKTFSNMGSRFKASQKTLTDISQMSISRKMLPDAPISIDVVNKDTGGLMERWTVTWSFGDYNIAQSLAIHQVVLSLRSLQCLLVASPAQNYRTEAMVSESIIDPSGLDFIESKLVSMQTIQFPNGLLNVSCEIGESLVQNVNRCATPFHVVEVNSKVSAMFARSESASDFSMFHSVQALESDVEQAVIGVSDGYQTGTMKQMLESVESIEDDEPILLHSPYKPPLPTPIKVENGPDKHSRPPSRRRKSLDDLNALDVWKNVSYDLEGSTLDLSVIKPSPMLPSFSETENNSGINVLSPTGLNKEKLLYRLKEKYSLKGSLLSGFHK
ncbi:hypothetical protein PCE1_003766 [Barthelona sp. PCE]